MIRRIRLFVNNTKPEAPKIAEIVKEKFLEKGFIIDDESFDLGIAIGGDGSFLMMVKTTNFDSRLHYIGVNAGTLGFLQEVKPSEINKLIDELLEEKYRVDEIDIEEATVVTKDRKDKFYALNEIYVAEPNRRSIQLDVRINEDFLERYTGDGLLISTSSGSTAQNLSYFGSIVDPTLSTIQITPMGLINNTAYRAVTNPIVFKADKVITLTPATQHKKFIVVVDGEGRNYEDVESIEAKVRNEKIKMLRFSHYSFTQKINDKFLSK